MYSSIPVLLPAPLSLRLTDGVCLLPAQGVILLQAPSPGHLLPLAQRLQRSLRQYGLLTATISAGSWADQTDLLLVRLILDPQMQRHPQGYCLQVLSTEIRVEASTLRGLFYGICTLQQFLQQYQQAVPCLGCDEPFDVGQGQSREACQQRGRGRVHLDYLLQVREIAQFRGLLSGRFWNSFNG